MSVDRPTQFDLSELFANQIGLIDDYCKKICAGWATQVRFKGDEKLLRSMEYSLLGPGKRTRPALGLLLSDSLGVSPQRTLPWLIAIEMVHTYSLIHDDLPSMDNDDVRRGRPTNHKEFGEAIALLAGDTLLTEAFGLLATSYQNIPDQALKAVALLSEASGLSGMAGGQAVDLESKTKNLEVEQILDLHSRKTGALFRVICEGVGVLCGVSAEKVILLRDFGATLGLCFQLKDDLLDSSDTIEEGSLPSIIGLNKTEQILAQHTQKCLELLKELGLGQSPLEQILKWNQTRKK